MFLTKSLWSREGVVFENESVKGGLFGAKNSAELLVIQIDEYTKRNSSFPDEFS
jgi:hypothetical protein